MALHYDIATCSHASTAIDEVLSADINESGQELTHSSDTDAYVTWADLVRRVVTVVINTDSVKKALDTFSVGAKGTLAFTINTADGGSNLAVAVSNAVLMGASASPKHKNPEAGGSLRFTAYSSDGTTSPLAIT